MKILFLGDYSNLHSCLADELKRRGHQVTLVSDGGGYMQTDRDVHLARGRGMAGAATYLYRIFSLLPSWSGYDVVQIINPLFLKLKPGKIRYFYNALRRQNGSVFLTLAGSDHYFVKACLDGHTFRFSEYSVGERRTEWYERCPERYRLGYMHGDVETFTAEVYDTVDGAMSVLPEYDMASRPLIGDKMVYTGIPIDLSRHPFMERDFLDGPLRFFIGIKREHDYLLRKGTGILSAALDRLEEEYAGVCEVVRAEGMPLRDYIAAMRKSHILVDQYYAYAPATNALNAMAQGVVAATGAEPEYFRYINEAEGALVRLSPEIDPMDSFMCCLENRDKLHDMSMAARGIVERHNDVKVVADKFLSHWESMGGKR